MDTNICSSLFDSSSQTRNQKNIQHCHRYCFQRSISTNTRLLIDPVLYMWRKHGRSGPFLLIPPPAHFLAQMQQQQLRGREKADTAFSFSGTSAAWLTGRRDFSCEIQLDADENTANNIFCRPYNVGGHFGFWGCCSQLS